MCFGQPENSTYYKRRLLHDAGAVFSRRKSDKTQGLYGFYIAHDVCLYADRVRIRILIAIGAYAIQYGRNVPERAENTNNCWLGD